MKKSPYNWRRIPMTKGHVDLRTLLTCGQTFSWKETGDNVWSNVLNSIAFSLKQTESELLWCTPLQDFIGEDLSIAKEEKCLLLMARDDDRQRPPDSYSSKRKRKAISPDQGDNDDAVPKSKCSTSIHVASSSAQSSSCPTDSPVQVSDVQAESILCDYFQLSVDLPSLYKQWADVDKNFKKVADTFLGIRILRQDPTENLFSFICSSNNHVSRISGMVQKLAENFGQSIGTIDDTTLYKFPTATNLDSPEVEAKLRALGFGYRAKYIAATAKIINRERPEDWLNSLRKAPYDECINELTKLQGVGRKVADCVALMSLDKSHVVPVDTHVLQIATRDYCIPGITKNIKTLTPAVHDKISKYFFDLYGNYAGWAHTVLFAADLKRFSNHATTNSTVPGAKTSKPHSESANADTKPSKRRAKSKSQIKKVC